MGRGGAVGSMSMKGAAYSGLLVVPHGLEHLVNRPTAPITPKASDEQFYDAFRKEVASDSFKCASRFGDSRPEIAPLSIKYDRIGKSAILQIVRPINEFQNRFHMAGAMLSRINPADDRQAISLLQCKSALARISPTKFAQVLATSTPVFASFFVDVENANDLRLRQLSGMVTAAFFDYIFHGTL